MQNKKLLIIIFIITMIVTGTQSLRVAILGSGVTGSTVARTLADRGVQVTVFEAGYGIGGRTSTRITRDDAQYQFDHGAQYITKPKTDTFQKTLDQWKRDGWVKEWTGKFGTVGRSSEDDQCTIQIEDSSDTKERWVGYPAMNSICRNLLHHENIQVILQTKAHAIYKKDDDQDSKWDLLHGKENNHLGTFDWLVVTDRNSGAHFRKDLSSANMDEFRKSIRSIRSVKSLAAMVVFDKPLNLEMDAIQFDPKNYGAFGSLGWAARDTSKPGRDRKDGKECWVLQSHPHAANEILKGMKSIEKIREKAKDVLVHDFVQSLSYLASSNNKNIPVPKVEYSVGHRWGAAFPIPSKDYTELNSELFPDQKCVTCGDYFGTLSGRIEGAYLSGISAADQLLCEENFAHE